LSSLPPFFPEMAKFSLQAEQREKQEEEKPRWEERGAEATGLGWFVLVRFPCQLRQTS
jgi:hypothetical protein